MAVSFNDDSVIPDNFYTYSNFLRDFKTPIVIDNGSYKCRAGWATNEQPLLVFKPINAKFKSKKSSSFEMLTGNNISMHDQSKLQCKTPFEKNITTQFDIQEHIFDYIFEHLQISHTQHIVNHPIVLTEPFCNPSYCREKMNELLFECYQVPSVLYGVDAFFAHHYNNNINNNNNIDINKKNNNTNNKKDNKKNKKITTNRTVLIISIGYNASHIIPVVDSKISKCRRFNFGGGTMDWFLMKTLQLKYPSHLASITLPRCEEICQQHCRMAYDFTEELMMWTDDKYYEKNVTKYQLPFNQINAQKVTAEQQKEKQQEQARKLREINLKRRRNKLAAEQSKLQEYQSIMDLVKEEEEDDDEDTCMQNQAVVKILANHNLSSLAELKSLISTHTNTVNNITLTIEQYQDNEGGDSQSKSKKPRLGKGKYVTEPPIGDEDGMKRWIDELRTLRKELIDEDMRKKKAYKNEVKCGRRSLASVERMKFITKLSSNTVKDEEDDFGWDDEDWNIYKDMDDGRSGDWEELDRLEEVEWCLQEYDPEFKKCSKSFNVQEYYQLHAAIEKIRTTELLMQPSIVGSYQAGLCEGLQEILGQFSAQQQEALVQNILVVGACAKISGLKERIEKEVRQFTPCQSEFNVRMAENGSLDAWKGARMVARDGEIRALYSVERKEWLENEDVFKESPFSNILLNKKMK